MLSTNRKKAALRTLLFAGLTVASSMGTVAIAQSFAPGGGGFGDVFGSGGGIYQSGGIGDIFGGGGFGDIFGDVLGGVSGGADCGDLSGVIVNFAPEYECGGGGSYPVGDIAGGILNGDTGGIFDTVYDVVGSELGLPSEVIDVISGDASVEGIFEDILNDALGSIGIENAEAGSDSSVVGAMGIPTYDEMMADIAGEGNDSGLYAEDSPGLLTPNIIPSLMYPTRVMGALTETTSERVLGETGQALGAARSAGSKTAIETSGMMGQAADMSAQGQVAVMTTLAEEIGEQESTQDTLKVALAGMGILDAQSRQFDSIAANQRALGIQMSGLSLDVAQETNVGMAVTSRGIQQVNESLRSDEQKELAETASIFHEFSVGTKIYGAAR